MSEFYFAKGIVRYKGDWVTVECPYGVVKYYQWWVEKFLGKKTSTSYHKPHITVLSGKYERGLNKHPLWEKHNGKEIEFKYESRIYTDHKWFFRGEYFWLRVECPFLRQLRTELGLKPESHFPYHLTICYCGY